MRFSTLRILLYTGVAVGLLALLHLLLQLTDQILILRTHLQGAPDWLVYGSFLSVTLLIGGLGHWAFRLLRRPKPAPSPSKPPLLDPEQIQAMIQRNQALGAEVAAAERELAELHARKAGGEFHMVLLGEISTGKSALIQALLPDTRPEISPVGGTTRQITRHVWITPAGDRLILSDLPGLNEVGEALSAEAKAEAMRAHVVIYLCDGDLTRTQFQTLAELAAIGKPLLVALNKIDRYSDQELGQLQTRLHQRVQDLPQDTGEILVIPVVSGGSKEVLKTYPDGRRILEQRRIPVKIEALCQAIQRVADRDPTLLDQLRDHAVFHLAAGLLDQAMTGHRREQAESLITSYSRKAVIGAMASVTPGLDVAVQGYLGYQLVKELCGIYQVSVREVDIQQFLSLTNRRALGANPVLLALAGNVLKSFPGLGTVAGGLCHAVAYGLIFDTLGRAVMRTLEQRGELAINPAVSQFDQTLGLNLEQRFRQLFKIALEGSLHRPPPDTAPNAEPPGS